MFDSKGLILEEQEHCRSVLLNSFERPGTGQEQTYFWCAVTTIQGVHLIQLACICLITVSNRIQKHTEYLCNVHIIIMWWVWYPGTIGRLEKIWRGSSALGIVIEKSGFGRCFPREKNNHRYYDIKFSSRPMASSKWLKQHSCHAS